MQAIPNDVSSEILNAYNAMRPHWLLTMWTAGRGLFTLLAIIDFASATTWLAIERRSVEEWAAGMLRVVIRIGIFYTLLVYGADWIAAIVTTFQELGQRGSGFGSISPDDIMKRGWNVTWSSLAAASAWGILTNFAALIVHIFSSIVAGLAFVLIAISYVVLMVEAFACLTAGYIFLAFGGSRWTVPYVERYIALSVSIGVKYLLFYFLIGVGMSISTTWAASVAELSVSAAPGMSAFAVMSQSLTFLMLCWQIPKVFSAMLGGSPALTMGDLVSTSLATVGTAAVATYAAARAGGAAVMAAASKGSGSASALPPHVPPPSSGAGGSGSSGAPPHGGNGGGGSVAGGSGGGGASNGSAPAPKSRSGRRGYLAGRATQLPSDHASAPSPPKMPMNTED